jgi:hypothetical protein
MLTDNGLVPAKSSFALRPAHQAGFERFASIAAGWHTNRLPPDETTVNEGVHDSAIARFHQIVPARRGEQVRKQRYRRAALAPLLPDRPQTPPLRGSRR